MRNQLSAAARATTRLIKLGKPTHCSIVLRHLFGVRTSAHSDDDHLRAAMEWLCKAQDVSGGGGVCGAYTFYDGWTPPYPETTGYIIPTFLKYASLTGNESYSERAMRMGDWEIDIQLPAGGVRGGMGVNEYPLIFNTGQVVLGWMALYRETNMGRFLDAAKKAADWLVGCQDDDGRWSRHTFKEIPHAYHTRVAWSLFEVYQATNNEDYKHAAENNVLWALTHATENGWFKNAAFIPGEPPFTHTIAYTLRGLLEACRFLSGDVKSQTLDIVQMASERVMTKFELRKYDAYSTPKYLFGTLDENWNSKDDYSCLTGNAQLAIIWLRLYQMNNDARLLNSALKIIDHVKATQPLHAKNLGIRGGVPGSYPIWGAYAPFRYPNWAAKFLADAIMLQESIMKDLEGGNKRVNVSIMISSSINPAASVLISELLTQSVKPVSIIRADRSRVATLRGHFRKSGYIATAKKVLGHYRMIQSSVMDSRYYLEAYASSHNLTDWDTSLLRVSKRENIELLKVDSVNSKAAVDHIKARKIDVVVNLAWGIFKRSIIAAPRIGILNAHMGYLPAFRGMNVLEWSLFYSHPIGVTLSFIARGIDTGDILLSKEIPIDDADTIETLRAKSVAVNVELFVECIKRLREGHIDRIEQLPEQGKQYFVMHPRLKRVAERRIEILRK